MRSELARVRQQGLAASSLVRQWQLCRQQSRPAVRAVALNDVVRRAVDELMQGANSLPRPLVIAREGQSPPGAAPEPVALWMNLAGALPAVGGLQSDFKRLLVFLIRNAVGAVGDGAGQWDSLRTDHDASGLHRERCRQQRRRGLERQQHNFHPAAELG